MPQKSSNIRQEDIFDGFTVGICSFLLASFGNGDECWKVKKGEPGGCSAGPVHREGRWHHHLHQAQPPAPALHGSACPEPNTWGHKAKLFEPCYFSEPLTSSPSSLRELVLPALLCLSCSRRARERTGSLHQRSTISSYLLAKALGYSWCSLFDYGLFC